MEKQLPDKSLLIIFMLVVHFIIKRAYLSCSARTGVRYSATFNVSTAMSIVAMPSAGAPSTVCLALEREKRTIEQCERNDESIVAVARFVILTRAP